MIKEKIANQYEIPVINILDVNNYKYLCKTANKIIMKYL